MGPTRAALRLAAGAAVAAACALPAAPALAASGCPARVDPAAFASAATLRTLTAKLDGPWRLRPTGSPQHAAFVRWLERQLRAIPGVGVGALPYRTRAWLDTRHRLQVGDVHIPLAGTVPFSASTGPQGITAPLTAVPAGTALTPENAAGRIVVRDLPFQTVPNLVFYPPLLGISMYDPGRTIDLLGSFPAEVIGQAWVDEQAAAAAGAKGVVFVSSFPRSQTARQYAPYEGLDFELPALYVGSDEGRQLKQLISAGRGGATKLMVVAASPRRTIRTVLATLPGRSDQRVVVDSHTDGTNPLEDNGPLAMIAMARYLAALPAECRARTVQFAFTTAHFHQHITPDGPRDGGAGQLAAQLDREYDAGNVAAVMTVEHLGAQEYAAPLRGGGHPGRIMQPTGRTQLYWITVTDSDALRAMVSREVARNDLRRTAVLQGLDTADTSHIPINCAFNGEGVPYNLRVLPVISGLAAPLTLFSSAFGLEAIDFEAMRREAVAYTDMILDLGAMTQAQIAGGVTAERARRAAGAKPCPPSS
jgi:hypothetical protein